MAVLNLPDKDNKDMLLYKYEFLLKPTEISLFDKMIGECGHFSNHNGEEGGGGVLILYDCGGMKEMGRVHSKIAHYGYIDKQTEQHRLRH